MRCSADEARRISGAPSAAVGLINRSRDRAGSTNQRVVVPRGSSEGYRRRRENETDGCTYAGRKRKTIGRKKWRRRRKMKPEREMKVHFFLGSKVSSRRGGRGPPPCSPAATGSYPPVPYVICITMCVCVRTLIHSREREREKRDRERESAHACTTRQRTEAWRTPLRY